jgi:hypothetical protein
MRKLFVKDRPTSLWRSFAGIVIGGVVAADCFGLAGYAYGDTDDDNFMKDVTSQGITGDRDTLIEDGHKWCDAPRGPFVTAWAASSVKQDIISQGYTYHDALAIIFAGERAYCPDQIPPKRGN